MIAEQAQKAHKAVKAATGATAVLAFLVPATAAHAAETHATAPAGGTSGTSSSVASIVTGTTAGVQHTVSNAISSTPGGLAATESNVAGGVSTAVSNLANAILPAPSGDAFYIPPNPLPPGKPGDIIWYRKVTPLASNLPPSDVYQVLYRSVDARGNAIAVSGDVFVPKATWTGGGARPLVAYASGTQGWGPQCAPSKEIASGTFDEQFAVSGLLAKGFAVAVTDEPGEGVPGPQLYTVGIAEGHAVLDSLRAATRIPGAGLAANAPTAVEGYSQGGGAAGWAAQQHHSYAPELNLKGVALGGTPANLRAVASNINGTAFFGFLGGSAIGFGAAYPSINLDSYLNDAGKKAFAELQTMCQEQGLATFAFQKVENYTKTGTNPMNEPPFSTVLDENNLGGVKPDVPVMQVHGLLDEVIPYRLETGLQHQWCAMGVKDDLVTFPTEHVTTGIDDQVAVVPWLTDRLTTDDAPPSNC